MVDHSCRSKARQGVGFDDDDLVRSAVKEQINPRVIVDAECSRDLFEAPADMRDLIAGDDRFRWRGQIDSGAALEFFFE